MINYKVLKIQFNIFWDNSQLVQFETVKIIFNLIFLINACTATYRFVYRITLQNYITAKNMFKIIKVK